MTKNIALVTGGFSGESVISYKSAAAIFENIDTEKWNCFLIDINPDGWFYTNKKNEKTTVDKNDFSIVEGGTKIIFDAVLIGLHGTPGEDGKLQGYLDIAGIPYTTCDVTTSALTFNKYFCNDLAIQYGVKVARTIIIRVGDVWDAGQLIEEVGLPCFIKPNKAGSSVGVSKVYDREGISVAVAKAFAEDDEVLVQQFIKGREMACGVFTLNGIITVLPVTEVISKNDFFDYEAKYTVGLASEITPAPISEEQANECKKITEYLYRKFNCKGVVRFDYFLTDNQWWFLEVNTVPGFSAESIIPKQAKTAGFTLKEFFGGLIEEALRKI